MSALSSNIIMQCSAQAFSLVAENQGVCWVLGVHTRGRGEEPESEDGQL